MKGLSSRAHCEWGFVRPDSGGDSKARRPAVGLFVRCGPKSGSESKSGRVRARNHFSRHVRWNFLTSTDSASDVLKKGGTKNDELMQRSQTGAAAQAVSLCVDVISAAALQSGSELQIRHRQDKCSSVDKSCNNWLNPCFLTRGLSGGPGWNCNGSWDGVLKNRISLKKKIYDKLLLKILHDAVVT